jgi:hypothetical protein
MFCPKGWCASVTSGYSLTADERLCSHSAAHCSVRRLLLLSISRRSNSALFAQVLWSWWNGCQPFNSISALHRFAPHSHSHRTARDLMTDKTSISAHTCPVPARNAALRSFSSPASSNRPTVAPTSTSLHCHTRLLSRRSLHDSSKNIHQHAKSQFKSHRSARIHPASGSLQTALS